MARVVSDPEELRRKVQQLEQSRTEHGLHGEELAALAEGCFRIAVHPDTPMEEASALMQKAIRLDGGNPKYAYHLARLLFRHGDLDRAGEWLRTAHLLCPTSHRVWTHIGLLQRDLNTRYTGRQEYVQDGLRSRAAGVLKRVREGEDAVPAEELDLRAPSASQRAEPREPEAEPARRFFNAGKCRWTGVYDLDAEDLLEAVASERWRDRLREPLDRVAALAARRRGGYGAFVILAVEWLLGGYPVAHVRRLLPSAVPEEGPAARLVEQVCALMEAGTEQLPGLLARATAEGNLPPLTAAVLHQRRLLGAPLRLKSLPLAFRAAERLVAGARSADAPPSKEVIAEHLRLLRNASRELDPAPFASIADFAVAASVVTEATPLQRCERLGEEAGRIGEALTAHLARVRELVRGGAAKMGEEAVLEANRIRRYASSLPDTCRAALAEIQQLRQAGATGEVVARLDELQEAYHDFPTRFGVLRRLLAPVREVAVPDDSAAPAQASPAEQAASLLKLGEAMHREVEELRARLKALAPGAPAEVAAIRARVNAIPQECKSALGTIAAIRGAGDNPQELVGQLDAAQEALRDISAKLGPVRRALAAIPEPSAAPEAAAPSADGLDALAADLGAVERKLAGYFADRRATFDTLAPEIASASAFTVLERSLRARQADSLYRLGRRQEARKIWAGLSAEDLLDHRLLRNIAVCDSTGDDLRKPLASWRAYAEMLYFTAAAAGDPAMLAEERAAFHREFGAAYGPAGLLSGEGRKSGKQSVDAEALVAFLSSPVRAGMLVDHLLLSFLHGRLGFHSPAILLGVRRSASEAARSKAHQKLLELLGRLEPMLPARSGARFAQAVRDRLEWAAGQCAVAARMTLGRDRHYERDQKRLIEWMRNAVVLLTGIQNAIVGCPEVLSASIRPEALETLCRLDDIALDGSPEFLLSVATTQHAEPDDLLTLIHATRDWFYSRLLQKAFPPFEARPNWDEQEGLRVYERLTGEWSGHLPEHVPALLDDPGGVVRLRFYPESVLYALQSNEPHAEAAETLVRLSETYRASAMLAYHCAHLLLNCRRFRDAATALERGAKNGCTDEGRSQCRQALEQLRGAMGGAL